MSSELVGPDIPMGTLVGVGHTTPAKQPHLPAGVVASRTAAIMAERAATAGVIIDLEKQVIDRQNILIRVETILREVKRSMARPMMISYVQEALKVLAE